MIYLFDIRIFVSRVARNYTSLRFVDDSFLWKRKKKNNDRLKKKEEGRREGRMENSSGKRINFDSCAGLKARNRCRNVSSNQISNLLTGWNREGLDEKLDLVSNPVCPSPPLSWFCVPKLTKHTHASSRQLSDEGESANLLDASRFESYRSRTGGRTPSDPSGGFMLLPIVRLLRLLLLRGFIGKFPYFFFFHSRVPLSSMSSMSFQRRSLKIRTKMNWYVFPRFLIFERENGRSWRIRERESAFRFIFPIDIGHCCMGMNLIVVSVYAC